MSPSWKTSKTVQTPLSFSLLQQDFIFIVATRFYARTPITYLSLHSPTRQVLIRDPHALIWVKRLEENKYCLNLLPFISISFQARALFANHRPQRLATTSVPSPPSTEVVSSIFLRDQTKSFNPLTLSVNSGERYNKIILEFQCMSKIR